VTKDTNAFRKIQNVTKLSNNCVELDTTSNNAIFRKINNLYTSNSVLNNNSYYYGTNRQHNFSSKAALLPTYTTLIDNTSFKNFSQYSLGTNGLNINSRGQESLLQLNKPSLTNTQVSIPTHLLTLNASLNSTGANLGKNCSVSKTLTSLLDINRTGSLNTLNDKQNLTNSLRYVDTSKKISFGADSTTPYFDEFISTTQNNFFS
jgi:hypothetical protein